MTSPRPVSELLSTAARTRGGTPLLTHYRPELAERTELSHASFANWVDKTANLIEALDVDAESEVAVCVLAEYPAHWMSLIWPFALWQRGLPCDVRSRADAGGVDLAVIGPDAPDPVGIDTLACSLHPWGLPLGGLPDGVLDFSTEALAQPDAHLALPASPGEVAWIDGGRRLTFADVAGLPGESRRLLLRPTSAWDAVSALVSALAGGGSVVLVEGGDDEAVARIASDERTEA